jgi:phospholipid-binding lipoprotein MlaA
MTLAKPFLSSAARRRSAAAVARACVFCLLVAACAAPPLPADTPDPYEARNRKVHNFNNALDQNIVRPSAFGYGGVTPGPLRTGIQNFALNLGLPGDIINGILQGQPGAAVQNTARLLVNTTVGIGGIFDPATAMGIDADPTGFGETLHVWGMPEGNYIELPLIGPSNDRDALGLVMDIALDPLRFTLPTAEANASTGIQILAGLGRRYRYSDAIDSILYESADSYAQLKLLYLQNRRFELGQTVENDADFVDPYEDPYAE